MSSRRLWCPVCWRYPLSLECPLSLRCLSPWMALLLVDSPFALQFFELGSLFERLFRLWALFGWLFCQIVPVLVDSLFCGFFCQRSLSLEGPSQDQKWPQLKLIWRANRCFGGQKWRGNILNQEMKLALFRNTFWRASIWAPGIQSIGCQEHTGLKIGQKWL